ncbi:Ala-tRNA(Pro) hydrolase [Roseovarius nanhaiticus]|uniref:Alanine--tRNA ligase n=1 Tax=Roseovarius nanhaiticus TaxID=573024 RepID=A0A1N7GV36_9RHOB|nr:alanyl-tRNA editing protein [Roseovarius nanhaiticus]SEL31367.1 Ala-tRNA(Pro) hydrolase [Roseovarius nanhaiticus]SIS16422.1 Ala-tRNA(Pro) hydrolase [Roseovarius nanhaiticus]
MTHPIFLDDPYCADAPGRVVAHTAEGGIVLDRSIFYPTGGGQPGDSGHVSWAGGGLDVATTVKGDADAIVLVPAAPQALPPVGMQLQQVLDWPRRHRLMRMHTGLHLLSVVIPLPVSGGAIAEARSRLDFDMPEAPEDPDALEAALNALVDADLPVTEDWITGAELDANPELVKTMSVAPPRGAGRIRLVQIGNGPAFVDRQPCGGTHVARTGEIGQMRIGKIEKKGRQNRRVYLHLDN